MMSDAEVATSDAEIGNNIAACLFTGQGVERDLVEAVRLFRIAAGQGSAGAQNNLGLCHITGQGVQQDDGEAARL